MVKKDLSVIIVNFNTKKLLSDCLLSIKKETKGIDYEIIVVDNASSDGSTEMLKSEFPEVRLIANDDNVGFAKANNQGIKIANGDNILLLNSDTVLLENSLLKVFDFSKSRPNIGIVGCKVLNRDDSIQISCWHYPTFITELLFFTKCTVVPFKDPITWHKYMKYWEHNEIKEVDCISGSFLWAKNDVFRKVGFLDDEFFMFYEDSEFCRRVKTKSNYKIYYYPFAKIRHFRGASSFVNNINPVAWAYSYKSARVYIRKVYGRGIETLFHFINSLLWAVKLVITKIFNINTKTFDKFMNAIKY